VVIERQQWSVMHENDVLSAHSEAACSHVSGEFIVSSSDVLVLAASACLLYDVGQPHSCQLCPDCID
jgi:hypothetical protein